MHTPCALTANEFCCQLNFPPATPTITDLLSDIRARVHYAPQTRFILDCAAVEDLSFRVLADLADLREQGCDLVLTNCRPALRKALVSQGFATLLGGLTAAHAAHPLRGPHAAFRRRFGARA